jgi:hypothetical protein
MTRHFCFAVLAALAGAAAGCSRGEESRPAEGRLSRLQAEVERQREASAKAAADYAPKVKGPLDDLTAPAADLLRQLPGVVEVEALVSPAKPTRRIIHLRDWHFVPEDLFALDLRNSAGKPLSDEEAKARYREFLLAGNDRLASALRQEFKSHACYHAQGSARHRWPVSFAPFELPSRAILYLAFSFASQSSASARYHAAAAGSTDETNPPSRNFVTRCCSSFIRLKCPSRAAM